MDKEITIQEARLEHSKAIVTLWQELMEIHLKLDADFFYASEYATEDYKAIISDAIKNASDEKKVFVALHNDLVVGYVTIEIVRFSMLLYNFDPFCVIGDFMVTKSYRNQGLGKLFINEAKKIAQVQNVKKLKLHVFSKNQIAYQFFKHLGFGDMMYQMTKSV
jgi:GNAT superfamily N-acetyltransferase